MNGIADWQGRALAALKRRMLVAEEDRSDLIAFAQGHAGATSAIHAGVLALASADDRAALLQVVIRQWPSILGLDAIALAIGDHAGATRIGLDGEAALEPRLLRHYRQEAEAVTMRCVSRGHPLFGPAAVAIRSEALIAFAGRNGMTGLLLMGQGSPMGFDCREGAALLTFLGQMLCAMLERCPAH